MLMTTQLLEVFNTLLVGGGQEIFFKNILNKIKKNNLIIRVYFYLADRSNTLTTLEITYE